MSSEKKIRATLSSQHRLGDPKDAPDRMFTVRPKEPIAGHPQKDWIISDIHDGQDRYVVEEVEGYRFGTDIPSGDIEIFIDLEFFEAYGVDQKRAAYLLWSVLIDANRRLRDHQS